MTLIQTIKNIANHKNYKNATSRWSHSKLCCYEACPRQFFWRYIIKPFPFKTSPAMERGKVLHNKADRYVTKELRKVPKEISAYAHELKMLREHNGTKEVDYSYTKKWEPTKWNSWDDVWCISKLDSMCILSENEGMFVDYKTGNIYDSHRDQSDSYALSFFIHNPNIEYLQGEFWYFDKPDEEPGIWEYERSMHFSYLKNNFLKRYNRIAKDKRFLKKPSYKCNWCEFNINKGGECEPDK